MQNIIWLVWKLYYIKMCTTQFYFKNSNNIDENIFCIKPKTSLQFFYSSHVHELKKSEAKLQKKSPFCFSFLHFRYRLFAQVFDFFFSLENIFFCCCCWKKKKRCTKMIFSLQHRVKMTKPVFSFAIISHFCCSNNNSLSSSPIFAYSFSSPRAMREELFVCAWGRHERKKKKEQYIC